MGLSFCFLRKPGKKTKIDETSETECSSDDFPRLQHLLGRIARNLQESDVATTVKWDGSTLSMPKDSKKMLACTEALLGDVEESNDDDIEQLVSFLKGKSNNSFERFRSKLEKETRVDRDQLPGDHESGSSSSDAMEQPCK